MRDVRNRQQSLLAAVCFCAATSGLAEARPANDAARRELLAVKAREAALRARNGGEREWKAISAEYNGLVKSHPRNAEIRSARGDHLWELNECDDAIREWLTAVKIDPKNEAALRQLGEAHLAKGEPMKSLKFFNRASEAAPKNAMTHFNIANIACMFRHALGRTEEDCFDLAIKHFAEAHRLAPRNAEFAQGYAQTFYMLIRPDWKSALIAWKDCLNILPEKSFVLLHLARVHMKLGDADNARACLAEVTGTANERQKKRLEARIEAELSPETTPKPPEIENSPKPGIDEAPLPP